MGAIPGEGPVSPGERPVFFGKRAVPHGEEVSLLAGAPRGTPRDGRFHGANDLAAKGDDHVRSRRDLGPEKRDLVPFEDGLLPLEDNRLARGRGRLPRPDGFAGREWRQAALGFSHTLRSMQPLMKARWRTSSA